MHFLSMHELDRKSFRISEDASSEINMERTIQLLQQISLDLDHQTYCVLKIQRSQNKAIQHLKNLLKELKHIQTKIETKLAQDESNTKHTYTNTNHIIDSKHPNTHDTVYTPPKSKWSWCQCICMGNTSKVKHDDQ